MKKNETSPVHYNFAKRWNSVVLTLRNRPNVAAAFSSLRESYEEVAQFKYEESGSLDRDLARQEFELDLQIARVRCFNYEWLRKTFAGCDLTTLMQAIAEEIYPSKRWVVIDSDEDAIVTDEKRSIVFDLINFNVLSAGASLVLAQDKVYKASRTEMEEVLRFRQNRISEHERVLQQMTSLLNAELVDTGISAEVRLSSEV